MRRRYTACEVAAAVAHDCSNVENNLSDGDASNSEEENVPVFIKNIISYSDDNSSEDDSDDSDSRFKSRLQGKGWNRMVGRNSSSSNVQASKPTSLTAWTYDFD